LSSRRILKKNKENNFDFTGILSPADRPKKRSECAEIPRPCPFVSCRYHLYLDVFEGGELKINFKGVEIDKMPYTCALDVAEQGGIDLESIGNALDLTRERIRQIIEEGLSRIRANADEEVVKILFSFLPGQDE